MNHSGWGKNERQKRSGRDLEQFLEKTFIWTSELSGPNGEAHCRAGVRQRYQAQAAVASTTSKNRWRACLTPNCSSYNRRAFTLAATFSAADICPQV